MTTSFTIDLPDDVAALAEAEASRSSQSIETVLVDWLREGDRDLESLPNAELLAVCGMKMDPQRHAELSRLLEQQREGQLNGGARNRLSEFMAEYQRGLLRKARAIRIAVARGLEPGLD